VHTPFNSVGVIDSFGVIDSYQQWILLSSF